MSSSLALEIRLYKLMSQMLLKMVQELSDEQMSESLGEGNPPSWILGHLAIGNEFGVASLGGQPELLEEYMPLFGPGSPAHGDHPDKAKLVQMFEASRDRFIIAAEAATAEQLKQERDSPLLKAEFPLVIDLVGHLLTSHLSLHVGQLSAWRRAKGLASILKI